MDKRLPKRVGAAAAAGWWTILIAVVWLLIGWLAFLAIMRARPGWLLYCWGGGDLTWSTVHTIWLWFFGVFKVAVPVAVLIVVWLSLWARQLKRAARQS